MTYSSLEQLFLQEGIVLVEQKARWTASNPNTPFWKLAVEHYHEFRESNLLEAFGREEGLPAVWPTGNPRVLPFHSEHMAALLAEGALLLHDFPSIKVIGVVDPYMEAQIQGLVAGFDWHTAEIEIRVITPQLYSDALAFAFTEEPSDVFDEDLPRWAADLRLEAVTSFEELLTAAMRGFCVDVLPAGYILDAAPLGTEEWLLTKTKTVAWVASTRAYDPRVEEAILQSLNRRCVRFSVSPGDIVRWKLKAGEAPQKREREAAQAQSWQIDPQWPSDQIGISLFDQITRRAFNSGTSDIHFEPEDENVRVRFRIDGKLYVQAPLPFDRYQDLARRIKIYGGVDHSVKGIPQDAQATLNADDGTEFDVRISVMPIQVGTELHDSIVIRLLDRTLPSLSSLGLDPKGGEALNEFLHLSEGLFLVTGPTGSGKTTTLYACLNYLNEPDTAIITAEQPIEKQMSGVRQVPITDNGVMTFSNVLRSIVRQNPNVIMVGEIRDSQSAVIAVQAALTGHLLLSTVHTNDAVGAVDAMVNRFGVNPNTLSQALRLVMAQRLPRLLCSACKQERPATAHELRFLREVEVSDPVSGEPQGCPVCNFSGFKGRRIIGEVFRIDEMMQTLISDGARPSELRARNRARGYLPIGYQASLLAQTGMITVNEARKLQV